MIELPAEGDVLAGHPVKGPRSIPRFEWISGILREVRRTGSSRGPVDWRKQDQIPSRIVNSAAAQRKTVFVRIKPQPVVKHKAEKALFRMTVPRSHARNATAMLASDVAC